MYMNIKIALFGFGDVGSTTAEYLIKQQANLLYREETHRTNTNLKLEAVFTRSPKKITAAGLPSSIIHSDWKQIINNKEINCIVELMGGIEFPKLIIIEALKAGKYVVSANKALLAHHGAELLSIARTHNTCIAFEASCGGGIPIIKALTEGLTANKHSALYGVMNGTCNFILTEMKQNKLSFDDALKSAMRLGLAEADPSLDIDGLDAGHKIAILSSLAFKKTIVFDNIPIVGISEIQNKDIYFASKLHYTMKLIAASMIINHKLSIWVHPAFLPQHHPMTSVEGSFNAISTISNEVGHTLYYGRGAGGKPTNSAIIADLISIANGTYQTIFDNICNWTLSNNPSLTQTGIESLQSEVYIRVQVQDNSGTLNKITAVLADHNISIARVLQEDSPHSPFESNQDGSNINTAELIIITHIASFGAVQKACTLIATLEVILDTPSIYPIIHVPRDGL